MGDVRAARPEMPAPDERPALPPAMRALVAGYDVMPATAGESGAWVVRLHAPGRPTCYLKSATGEGARAIVDESERLHWLDGRAGAPSVVAVASTPDGAFLLTAAVAGASARERLSSRASDAEAIAAALGRHLHVVHALPPGDCPFDAAPALRLAAARRNLAAGLVDASDFDDDHIGTTPAQLYAAMEALLPLPFGRVVTHGDYSLDNLFLDGERVTGCIDWGRAGLSDPYQDLAIAWRDLGECGTRAQRAFLHGYGIEAPDRRRLDFFRCLDEFF